MPIAVQKPRCGLRVAAALVTLSACGVEPQSPQPTQVVERWLLAATPGRAGGKGGSATLLYSEWTVPPGNTVNPSRVFQTSGGRGGSGGKAALGRPAVYGAEGAAGSFTLKPDLFVFDATGIRPDQVLDSSGALTLSLQDNLDPLAVIRVDTFHIAAGSHLEVGCDVRIQARQFTIEQGGSLVVRGRNSARCTLGTGTQLDRKPSLLGGQLLLEADTFELGGTIDVAGNPGAPGEDGAAGGVLLIRASHVRLHEGAQVLASGGDGADGTDEQPVQ